MKLLLRYSNLTIWTNVLHCSAKVMADTASTKAKHNLYTKQDCKQKSFCGDQMEFDNVTFLPYVKRNYLKSKILKELESFNEKIVSTVWILKALQSYLFY